MLLHIVLLGDINLVLSPGVWKYQINVFSIVLSCFHVNKESAFLKNMEEHDSHIVLF